MTEQRSEGFARIIEGADAWDYEAKLRLRDKFAEYQGGDDRSKFFIVVDWPENTEAVDDDIYRDEVMRNLRPKHIAADQVVCAVYHTAVSPTNRHRYITVEVFADDKQQVELGCVTIRLHLQPRAQA
jgi:hypothetical protein